MAILLYLQAEGKCLGPCPVKWNLILLSTQSLNVEILRIDRHLRFSSGVDRIEVIRTRFIYDFYYKYFDIIVFLNSFEPEI